ncbi:RES domain-containing protein [Candidatus Fermentibacteria bacterium]|nr:RES domain-containing protein [Candidatus Fermentibacteria bacterium]
MTAWRIVQSRHAKAAFAGEGARLYPGRWNQRGIRMVYTAGSLSLAALEMLAHLGTPEFLSLYVSVPITFDESICLRVASADLPADWADDPPPASTRRLGTEWVRRRTSAVLAVPSAIVRVETNFLLNPAHSDFARIGIGGAAEFRFDPRLTKPR